MSLVSVLVFWSSGAFTIKHMENDSSKYLSVKHTIELQMMLQHGLLPYRLSLQPSEPPGSHFSTILFCHSIRSCHVPVESSIILCQNNKYTGQDIFMILSSSKQFQEDETFNPLKSGLVCCSVRGWNVEESPPLTESWQDQNSKSQVEWKWRGLSVQTSNHDLRKRQSISKVPKRETPSLKWPNLKCKTYSQPCLGAPCSFA
jgi:hypothetical protein